MKILCVSDTVVQQMENAAHLRRRYHDVELVVSCGDLSAAYLEFITSVLNVPLFYVRGNHDTAYDERPPGGENLHQRIVTYRGLTFVGLEGSIRYNNSPIQYTDSEMLMMVMKLAIPMNMRKLQYGRGCDILVTHSPPKGIHDMPDRPHNGLSALLRFMEWYRPRYLLHGHVHTWDRRVQTTTQYLDTTVININPVTLLEVDVETRGARVLRDEE
ncbi:MAG: metallophosphoesterase family protein [Anaerolinea sp.]|nr:metallophosphoesterase family protein [Anaerolinea sp.]